MVSSGKIEQKLLELSEFFSSVIESGVNSVDRDTAKYGLKKIRSIDGLIEKYKKTPKNIYLKQIHSSFFSATRGVEGFIDNDTNDLFVKKCEGIYDIIQELEKTINW